MTYTVDLLVTGAGCEKPDLEAPLTWEGDSEECGAPARYLVRHGGFACERHLSWTVDFAQQMSLDQGQDTEMELTLEVRVLPCFGWTS